MANLWLILCLTFSILLILSLLGLAVCNYRDGDYKTFVIGLMFAVCNGVIFFWKDS
jgi:heme/copper-type cytochrome/quinol oxidase subunit 3